MAGSHETSVDFADADLFVNKVCILTPTDNTNKDAIKTISDLWQMIGASIKIMPPDDHDYLVSAISHLPHTVACALVNVVSDIKNAQGYALDFAASGFADATRIASGSPDLWKGILLQNAEKLISMISKVEAELAKFRAVLEAKDGDSLVEILTQAKNIRDSFKK
jgi:prephenate dehydrogenase